MFIYIYVYIYANIEAMQKISRAHHIGFIVIGSSSFNTNNAL